MGFGLEIARAGYVEEVTVLMPWRALMGFGRAANKLKT